MNSVSLFILKINLHRFQVYVALQSEKNHRIKSYGFFSLRIIICVLDFSYLSLYTFIFNKEK